jgi:hypothetical protein
LTRQSRNQNVVLLLVLPDVYDEEDEDEKHARTARANVTE